MKADDLGVGSSGDDVHAKEGTACARHEEG